jgi:hypothetical protein
MCPLKCFPKLSEYLYKENSAEFNNLNRVLSELAEKDKEINVE